jgi:hypothetical protein
MAWLGTDSAESYSNGNSIDTLNGGSGWAAAWSVAGAGTKDIVNTPTLQGSLCFRLDKVGNQEPRAYRSVANTTSGSISWIGRFNNATKNAAGLRLREAGTAKADFWFDNNIVGGFGDAHFVMTSGAGFFDLGTFAADTNYTIVIDYDNSTDQFRVSTDGGSTFSGWKSYASVATNFDDAYFMINAEDATNSTFYFDDIKPYSAVVATSTPELAPVPISGGISDSGGGMSI